MARSGQQASLRPKLIALSVAACFGVAPVAGLANPTGPTVVSGSASFAASGNLLSVTNSANAIIQWQGFSIGVNEITRFIQPSALSAVLNRVVGSGGVVPQSLIDGVLSSNGRVFLLNPSGVVFGSTARIDVAGLVASSLNLSNEDFLAGRLRFTEIPGAGGVANHGVIETASGGRVFLVAPDVQNTGIIRSPQGDIVLAAGRRAELVSEANPYVTVSVAADAEQALNVGSLVADSGRIGMYGALVRNAGVVEAGGATVDAGGNIRLVATRDLTLDAGSRVAANGSSGGNVLLQAESGTNLIAGTVEATGASGQGGEIKALGVRVGVIGNGVIDASGETGGGTVLLGGDFQGNNPAIQNAQRTYVGPDGVIRADARTSGNGGRVIVWADGDTRFAGSISARGGAQSGDGGFVETSGKQQLVVSGSVSTLAPMGAGGTWLLDPDDADLVPGSADPGLVAGAFADPIDGNASQIGVDTIVNSMATNGFVNISANDDVNFLASVNAPQGTFSAFAGRNINLNSQSITTGAGGGVNLYADSNSDGIGSITSTALSSMTQIRTVGGGVDLRGANVTVAGIDTSGSGTDSFGNGLSGGVVNIFTTLGTGVVSTGTINTRGADGASNVSTAYGVIGGYGGSGGSVSVYNAGSITTGSIIVRGGDGGSSSATVNATGSGGTYQTVDVYGGSGGSGGTVDLTASGPVVVGGDIDARGGAGGNAGSGTLIINASGVGVDAYVNAYGGSGGGGNDVTVYGGSVTVQSILVHGGPGGRGGTAIVSVAGTPTYVYTGASAQGGYNGGGDDIDLTATSGALIVNGGLDASSTGPDGVGGRLRGGDGGMASISVDVSGAYVNAYASANGSGGGGATEIRLAGNSSVSAQSISAQGTDGGSGGTAAVIVRGSPSSVSASADASGGGGTDGDTIEIFSGGPVTVAGAISARSGNGARGGSATVDVSGATSSVSAYSYANGGRGGTADATYIYPDDLYATVHISAGGHVSTADIDTSAGSGANGGTASTVVSSSGGTIYAVAYAYGGDGGEGGPVRIDSASTASIGVGNIFTLGGSGASGGNATTSVSGSSTYVNAYASAGGGHGFYGGFVNLSSLGDVRTGSIVTFGGSGGNGGTASVTVNGATGTVYASANAQGGSATGFGGSLFYGGSVSIGSNGSVTTGPIITAGGAGAPGGTASVSVTGPATYVSASTYATGGRGFYGGSVGIIAGGPVSTGIILALAGSGGAGGSASTSISGASGSAYAYSRANGGNAYYGGSFGTGGLVGISSGATIATGPIFTLGSNGGAAGSASVSNDAPSGNAYLWTTGGDGGMGGLVGLSASGSIVTGAILSGGGSGGSATSGSTGALGAGVTVARYAAGGHGADGGQVGMSSSNGSIFAGLVNTAGGVGGASGMGGGDGGDGGHGGAVAMVAPNGSIEVGPEALPGVFINALNTAGGGGGAGGAAASPAGNGGIGGDGGAVMLDATAVTVNGTIITNAGGGGAGGAGDASNPAGSGGSGGAGGSVGLFTPDGTGQITFIQAGLDQGTSIFTAGTPEGLVTLEGSVQYLLLDPLAVQAVAQAVGRTVEELAESVFFEEEEPSESEEDKQKKARMAICRPRT